ncbi:hypothetical protein M409DRAFT_65950 [Zasmidium cellare ATCC 36951]|uniref:DUF1349 domain-containing protein n=1 Tax=Zasmidium cellare ATCC 36951 TaxID=1080233 RepID=A0A6A6CLH1_ZASCE|nr:uncharacterized protein M409DRAFT_65950 [Zasmidium cellare ATCC 36951]KAF2167891.1 hypothetical protein M409DRAFT_65950 [Zasmidium cellare ATCC 36951]
MPSSTQWQTLNGATAPSDDSSFTITAPTDTDIWRRSDTDDVFTAPILYRTLPSQKFKSLTVTIFAPWKTQYDQGGLILAFPNPSNPTPPENTKGLKWLKAGIEFFSNACVLGVVGTDRYSDWSISPMKAEFHQKATFRVVREGEGLWVYAKQEGGEGELGPVWVGVYAAKPKKDEGIGGEENGEKGLEVTFSDLELEVEE